MKINPTAVSNKGYRGENPFPIPPVSTGTPIIPPQPKVAQVADKTKYPRQCITSKQLSISISDGLIGIPKGAEFQLKSPFGDRFVGNYNGTEIFLSKDDFSEIE